jgi:hypothetical protein
MKTASMSECPVDVNLSQAFLIAVEAQDHVANRLGFSPAYSCHFEAAGLGVVSSVNAQHIVSEWMLTALPSASSVGPCPSILSHTTTIKDGPRKA